MRKWLILLSVLSTSAASAAPAWTWVDSNGTVHFSDKPQPGATQIELQGVQGFGSQRQGTTRPPAAGATTAARSQSQSQPAPANQAAYRAVTIVSPLEQQTLWNLGGNLSVQLAVDPGLRPGHRVDIVLDGQRRNLNTTSSAITVPEVFRGTHTLEAVVLDTAGAEVSRSGPTTFMVQQTSIQNPNR
jgi:uncharacterized protein DUF4124